jgi:hypothetical protein
MALPKLWQLSLLFSASSSVQSAPQLKFGHTTLTGQTISPLVEFFGRIPYAEPPLGQLRLRSPILKSRLNVSTLDASDYGLSCIQPKYLEGDVPQSEDCLTINVHRPVGTKPSDRLPVFFWAYGGAWVVGGSPTYNGSQIVEHSVQRVSQSRPTIHRPICQILMDSKGHPDYLRQFQLSPGPPGSSSRTRSGRQENLEPWFAGPARRP